MINAYEMPINPGELGIDNLAENETENEVMETAREGRAELLIRAIQSRSAEVWAHPVIQKAINHAPLVGDVVMGYKLVTGKESGRKLRVHEKLLYTASIAASLAGVYYLYQGELTSAGLSSFMSESFTHADVFVSTVIKLAEKIKDARPDLANFALATSQLVSSKKEDFLKLKAVFDQSITQLDQR